LAGELSAIRGRLMQSTPSITEAQILQLWLLAKDSLVVTTSAKAIRIRESLEVADLPALTAGEVAAIDRVGSQHHFRYFHMDV